MINSLVKYVLGKVRLIGNTDGTLIGNVGDRMKVKGAADVSVFGANVSMPRQSHVKANWSLSVTANNSASTVSGTGSVVVSGANLQVGTGTGTTAASKVQSTDVIIYAPGREIYAAFTAAFTTPTSAASEQRAGLYDANNGIFLGFHGTTFGVTTRAAGVDTFTSTLNGDPLNGSASSLFTRNGAPEAIDKTKKNVYRIRYGWLGAAPVFFEVMSPDGDWVIFHTIRQPNLSTTPLIQSTTLPFTMEATKTASDATALTIRSSSWDAGVVDSLDADDTGSGSITSTTSPNDAVYANTDGKGTINFSVSGTWVGSLLFEGDVGDGQWQSLNGQSPSGTLVTTMTANGVTVLCPAGYTTVRIRATAWTSGTALVTWNATQAQAVLTGSTVTIPSTPAFSLNVLSTIATGATIYTTYTAVARVAVKQFYAGGTGIGRQFLYRYVAATTQFLNGGNFESTGDVANWPWTSVSGTGSAAYSTAQAFSGTGSVAVTFTNSTGNSAQSVKQTFGSPIDISGWRYITAQFYNQLSAGGAYTRTISIVVADTGGSTRTYAVSGTSTTSPFNASGWIKITGEIENPTSSTGATFDPTQIASVQLLMSDSANKAGTVYWDAAQLEAALTPLVPVYHQANISFNLPRDPVDVLNAGDVIAVAQRNADTARKEYYALVGGVSV